MMLKLREFTNSAAILSVTLFHFLDYESANQTNLFQGQSESVGKDNMAAYYLSFLYLGTMTFILKIILH